MNTIPNAAVARVFDSYPASIRAKLLELRGLILETASSIEGVGELEETLKWGEPAFLTKQSRTGTTIRINRRKSSDTEFAMYFHCNTDLIGSFRELFPDELRFEGNRGVIFETDDELPVDALRICIGMALTYHRDKRSRPAQSTVPGSDPGSQ